jgi:hypothetical protein
MSDPYGKLVERLALAMWGQTGTNGVVGTQIKDGARITRLEEFRLELVIIWRVVRWMGLAMLGLIGLLSSDTLGRILADLLKVAKP